MPDDKDIQIGGDYLRDQARKISTGGGDYIEGVAAGSDVVIRVREDTGEQEKRVPIDAAFERIRGASNWAQEELQQNYDQTRQQAKDWFRFSLIAAAVGFVVILIGVLVILASQTPAGIVSSIAGLILEAAAGLFFRQSTAANARTDDIQKKLTEWREVDNAMTIIDSITDPAERNRLRAEIVRKVMGLQQG